MNPHYLPATARDDVLAWQQTVVAFLAEKDQAVLRAAGLPRQRFHDLRDACASLLLAQGVAPRVVMETLGHSQIGLTLNTYIHVIPALGRAAADQMDAVLGTPSADIAAS